MPTHVEAVRALREKVRQKHGSEACLEKARLALAEEAGAEGTSAPANEDAFTALLSSQLEIQKAHRRVKAAEKAESELAKDVRSATALHETAQVALEEVS